MFQNIPVELQSLAQWVLWRYESVEGRVTKVPYSHRGFKANIKDPNSFGSFQEVLNAGPRMQANGIGLVLTSNDPYTGIDIDNKPENPASEEEQKVHQKILEAFPSYTERSVGGHGYHIIVRGKVPQGTDRGHVGVYSVDRYLTFTGQVVRAAPIMDCQAMLNVLYNEMLPQAPTVELQDRESILDDMDVLEMAMRASNADKFNSLCAGEISEYPSQSEADFALLSIIAYYTPDNEQVRRIFRMSALGKREKATRNNNYLNAALSKIRANEPPPVDMQELQANADRLIANMKPTPTPTPTAENVFEPIQADFPIDLPPGLMGSLAQYFYHTAIKPVPEMALAAAISLMAGVAGRSYNISSTGLNMYTMLLAGTGTGKESMRKGIDTLISAVRPQLPMIEDYIGPGAFASGQGLIKILNSRECFISILGEFGITLQELSDRKINGAQLMLKKVLLDVYNKSGHNDVLQSTAYSDQEKTTKPVRAPCISILGESNPTTFFESLNSGQISEGLIPRFLFIEYKGKRVSDNPSAGCLPPDALKQQFSTLAVAAIGINNNHSCYNVPMDDFASKRVDEYGHEIDMLINSHQNEVEAQMWNRAKVKVLKLAALVAVGVNPYQPVISLPHVEWAVKLVDRDCKVITKRFENGDVGVGDSKQFHDLKRTVEAYLRGDSKSTKARYGALMANKIIPYAFLLQRTANMSSFKADRLGATGALKRNLQSLVDSGMLVEVPKPALAEKYKFSGVAYGISGNWY